MSIDSSVLHSKLKEFFGFDSFKADQERVVRHLTDGNDAFVLMPTGGGTITLINGSEVDAQYKVNFTVPASPLAFTYTYAVDGGAPQTVTEGTFVDLPMNATAVITISWVWEFTDTNENALAGTTLDVTAAVVVEQVN